MFSCLYFPHALFYDCLLLEKFPLRIIKDSSHLHREKVSQIENNTDKDTEENRTRQKRERNVQTVKQAGRQIKQPNRPSQKNRCLLPAFPCPIWLCALQSQSSKPQQEVTLSALLPGFYNLPSLFTFCRDYTQHSSFTCSLFGKIPPVSLWLNHFVLACLCVRGCGCVIKGTFVFVCICHGGFYFYLWGYFNPQVCVIWHGWHLFLLVTECFDQKEQARQTVFVFEIGIQGLSQEDVSIRLLFLTKLLNPYCFFSWISQRECDKTRPFNWRVNQHFSQKREHQTPFWYK